MQIRKFLNIVLMSCSILMNNSNASVNINLNYNAIIINCDESNRIVYSIAEASHCIDNDYFTVDSILVRSNTAQFNNFNSKKNGGYDLYVGYNDDVITNSANVVLNYQNNQLIMPRFHLYKINKLDIVSIENTPMNGQINDIDSDKIFLNQRLLRDYENITVKRNFITIPKLTYDLIKTAVKDVSYITRLAFDRYISDPLSNLYRKLHI